MVKTEFLLSVKEFTVIAVGDFLLPTRVQGKDETPELKPAAVYLMRLPDSKSAAKKAPYILHQIVTAEDRQNEGRRDESYLQLRSIFCVYCGDEEQGGMMLVELMERLRIALLRLRILDRRFYLDLTSGSVQTLIYPDDTAPYFLGEMITTWQMPAVQRDIRPALE